MTRCTLVAHTALLGVVRPVRSTRALQRGATRLQIADVTWAICAKLTIYRATNGYASSLRRGNCACALQLEPVCAEVDQS